jgi:GDP-mannose 6-dehydrogenase
MQGQESRGKADERAKEIAAMARIGVFGLGYVGAVSMAALADGGHEMIGVDLNPAKVAMINAGMSPVVEAGLDELIAEGVGAGRIQATTDAAAAVRGTDVSLICVGTPSRRNGGLDLGQVERVSREIGSCLRESSGVHTVVVRSTMVPGSTQDVVIPALEGASGKRVGSDFSVVFNPEFLREGSSIRDFYDPPFTLIGSDDERATAVVSDLYAMVGGDPIVVPVKVAEMVKYACNAFHALKVTFANEIGSICKEQEIDSHRVMDIFCEDTKLNISTAYLMPGFAFGGSCLPKDLRALTYQARRADVDAPLLESILPSNRRQIDRAFELVTATGRKRVGVLGLSFKAGTDDLRESPMVELIEQLIGKGYDVRVYDRNVSLANLKGANLAYIEQEIPHIASLMVESIDEVLAAGEVLVIGNDDPEFVRVLGDARPEQHIVDLVRIGDPATSDATYTGICW